MDLNNHQRKRRRDTAATSSKSVTAGKESSLSLSLRVQSSNTTTYDHNDKDNMETSVSVLAPSSRTNRTNRRERKETQQQQQQRKRLPWPVIVSATENKLDDDNVSTSKYVNGCESIGHTDTCTSSSLTRAMGSAYEDNNRTTQPLSKGLANEINHDDVIDLTSSPETMPLSSYYKREGRNFNGSSKAIVESDIQKKPPSQAEKDKERTRNFEKDVKNLERKDNGKQKNFFTKRKLTPSTTFANRFSNVTQPHSTAGIRNKGLLGDTAKKETTASKMWIDKYSPTSLEELVVAPKKIKEVREWLENALSTVAPSQNERDNRTTKSLILTGNPGIGKSTMVRVLAKELNLNIFEWNEGTQPSSSNFGQNVFSSWLWNENRKSIDNNDSSSTFNVPSREQSPLDSFEEFLDSTGSGFTPLSIVGSKKHDRHDKKISTATLSKSQRGPTSMKRQKLAQEATDTRTRSLSRSLILIDEIPNLYNESAEDRFRSILSNHMVHTTTPTIMIYSDVTEGNVNELQLSKLVEEKLLHHNMFITTIHINKATNAKVKKCLSTIMKKERLSLPSTTDLDDLCETSAGDIRSAIMTLQFNLAANSYLSKVPTALSRNSSLATTTSTRNKSSTRKKDTRLSSFHALGKALYAKRCVDPTKQDEGKVDNSSSSSSTLNDRDYTPTWKSFKWKDMRPPLNFDPESVLMENPMGIEGAITFLQYHCVDFFTDETELSEALATYSDALSLGISGRRNGYSSGRSHYSYTFPDMYMASLSGRAVADANKHPMPNKFKALDAPKTFEVRRKRLANEQILQHMCRRFSRQSSSTLGNTTDDDRYTTTAVPFILPPDNCLGSSSIQFVTRTLPYLRRIHPNETHEFMSAMHSANSTSIEEKNDRKKNGHDGQTAQGNTCSYTASAKEDAIMLQNLLDHSKAILKDDDIVDDDDEF